MTEAALTRLARFVASDPLTVGPDAQAALRDSVIDTLGCIHAGVSTDVANRARAAVQTMGALGSAPVIGTTLRCAKPQAAFLNAIAGHALDFDDWEIPGNTHPTVVLLPALLAVADPQTSGKALAQAYVVGFEVIARLGEAMNFAHYDAGWHSTATLGAIGAAAACARLLGLTCSQTRHAMSLAVSTASGYTCQFGSQAKPVQAGFAARAGVEAACLAQAGIIAQAHVLDHPRGQAALMGGLAMDQMQATLQRLGQGYALETYGLVLKPWPSCGYTHRIMTCALALRDQLAPNQAAEQIAQIDLYLPDFHAAVLPFGQPTNRNEALFSLPYVAAMGLVRGRLGLADLDAESWRDRDIAELIAKVRIHPFSPRRPELNYAEEDPDRLVLRLVDGRQLAQTCSYPLGAPQAPMSQAQLWQKFTANTANRTASASDAQKWQHRLSRWPQEAAVLSLLTDEETPHAKS